MSTRTIIEINHDHLDSLDEWALLEMVQELRGTRITAALNSGHPVYLTPAIRILGQRHHSEPEWKQGSEG